MSYYVYILSNPTNVAIYAGVTKDLIRRVYEHRSHADPRSHTAKYGITKLVYYEESSSILSAIEREKQLKSWSRAKKNELVAKMNPTWADLYGDLLE